MSRLSTFQISLTLLLTCLAGFFLWQGSTRVESLQRELADTRRRVDVLEAVYDSSECVLSTEEDGGCLLDDGRWLFLGEADRDGEIRWLKLRDDNGQETRVGQLSSAASYVRLRRAALAEGFMSDAQAGLVEVYAASPVLEVDRDERLPIMIKKILQNE
jgi:hypothetical protein